MEILIVPKELINNDFDIKLYLFKTKISNKFLIYLFKYKNYFVYHYKFNFIIEPFISIIKNYVKESFKENDQNYINNL
mgnify:CR=1 FL=1